MRVIHRRIAGFTGLVVSLLVALPLVLPGIVRAGGGLYHVKWDTGISADANWYRDVPGIPPGRNIAVIRFTYPNGQPGTYAMESLNVFTWKRESPPSSVTEFYTDQEPCSRSFAYCKALLAREFSNADVYYSFSGKNSAADLKAAVIARQEARTTIAGPGETQQVR